MWNDIKAWYNKHTITTHTLTGAAATFALLYASVPSFKQLVDETYAAMPPRVHAIAAAVIGIVGFYLVANKKPVNPGQ